MKVYNNTIEIATTKRTRLSDGSYTYEVTIRSTRDGSVLAVLSCVDEAHVDALVLQLDKCVDATTVGTL